ncbi:hypothetical protein PIB30_014967 [Stylosanthes scabra]|uniref:Uncharacterized protein n=1 Tax=Stylosanthes scabra TaxID=79078 RepID=A0ABU6X4C8_9FABA|nr:hypothetical protein [Stylosanthes scabra]
MDPLQNQNPSSSFVFSLSEEEFIVFHKMDRELYRTLIMNLKRDPSECMQVMGMWLWLERIGFRNVVTNILSLPCLLINDVADETLACLNVILPSSSSLTSSSMEGMDTIPLLQSILDKDISLHFFHQNRAEALQGVAKVVQEVCVRAFSDIMASKIAEKKMNNNNNSGGGEAVPAEQRTMFVTFSKGYKVEEREVREFLTMAYGDCIEALYMQEVQHPNEQSLFARVVFRKASTIDVMLKGASKVKFTINGKHVCARKFVPKTSTSTSGTRV